MKEKDTAIIEQIMKDPVAGKLINNRNPGLIERQEYVPPLCQVFSSKYTTLNVNDEYEFSIHKEANKQLPNLIKNDIKVKEVTGKETLDNKAEKEFCKKRNIGIVFSGGPAPGGHNVIAGVYDAAKKINPETRIYGFILGPEGIIENEYIEITGDLVDSYSNLGGFSMIRTGRTKIDTKEKMAKARETCKKLDLDALVIIGGDDSNTNAAFLAEDFFHEGIQVIGVPKTIDGDIQVRDVNGKNLCAISFGFHTAARAFAKEVGGLCTDSSSDVKYWHFCKVMGRVASHLALEVSLQTHANMTLIGEDLANYVDKQRLDKAVESGITDYTAYGMTLRHLSRLICNGIRRRAAFGKNYGVIVIPEGVLEFINEIQVFIIKLNTIIAEYNNTHDIDFHSGFTRLEEKMEYLRRLAQRSRQDEKNSIWNFRDEEFFNDIPDFFKEGLLTERDSHGNFQFSQVKTDKIILKMVIDYLNILKENGIYKVGIKRIYYEKTMKKGNLDPKLYEPVLFRNPGEEYLLFNESIISIKTLKQSLEKGVNLPISTEIPKPITKLYKLSVPQFKSQTHFFGYNGRGSDPTKFDCNYTYNLGHTVFSLIVNGATGQMAAIKNLEKNFSEWEPIGIPIAPLMHLEERKGKLALVIEKSLVDLDSVSFKIVRELREKWLAALAEEDEYRKPGPILHSGETEEDRPITLVLNDFARHLDKNQAVG